MNHVSKVIFLLYFSKLPHLRVWTSCWAVNDHRWQSKTVKSLNLMFSNASTLGYGVGGSDLEKGGEGRWGVVRDIPSEFQNSKFQTGCFPGLTKRCSKTWAPPERRLTPAREERGPALTATLPSISQPRQVSLCAAPPEPLSSLKQNKRSLFARPGCALMERILFSQQQGVRNEDCGKRVFQKQEIRYVSSDWSELVSFKWTAYTQVFTHVGTVPFWWSLIYTQRFFLIGEVTGTQLHLQCPSVLRLLRTRFQRSAFSPHLSHFISNYKNDTLPRREQL